MFVMMLLQDGSGKFDMYSSRKWSSERDSKSSSTLGVPKGTDVTDDTSTTDEWILVDIKHKSVSPPPTSPRSAHTRTGSFDLHTIEPDSPIPSKLSPPTPKKTLRSVSAQADFEDDTAPLVESTDTKQHSLSLQRRGAIRRSFNKKQQQQQQQEPSNSPGKGDKKRCSITKVLSRSSSDLREIGTKSQKLQKKPPIAKRSGYWISMMDGFQRILLFTPQYSVVTNCEKANRFNFDSLEVNFTLRSVTITLIDNNTNREVLLFSILP